MSYLNRAHEQSPTSGNKTFEKVLGYLIKTFESESNSVLEGNTRFGFRRGKTLCSSEGEQFTN